MSLLSASAGGQLALSLGPGADRAHRRRDPPPAGFRFPGSLDGFRVLALVRVAQLAPPIPSGRRRFQGLREVGRWRHPSYVRVEIETDLERLATFQAGRFAVAAPEWNARQPAPRGHRPPVRVAV